MHHQVDKIVRTLLKTHGPIQYTTFVDICVYEKESSCHCVFRKSTQTFVVLIYTLEMYIGKKCFTLLTGKYDFEILTEKYDFVGF